MQCVCNGRGLKDAYSAWREVFGNTDGSISDPILELKDKIQKAQGEHRISIEIEHKDSRQDGISFRESGTAAKVRDRYGELHPARLLHSQGSK